MIDWSAYKNFSRYEFTCRCGCGLSDMQPRFMDKLQALREAYGRPLQITSGYRCPKHPAERVKPYPGMHATGLAADISIQGAPAVELLRLALEASFTGIGVQQKGTGRYLHLDLRAEPSIWSY